ncbi:MAG TPA: hypothetical protein DCL77_12950 [Prolixibacteraceae bacterium]|jgi:hypothetical protein|nr:hypothetical protein [Prolixibacteraceae bacterium]
MVKNVLLILCFPLLLQAQNIQYIRQLLDSLKTNPLTISDDIIMQQALAAQSSASCKLFPTVEGFGRYDYATNPTPMLPAPLYELFGMKADQTSIGQPFSYLKTGIVVFTRIIS